VKIPPEVAIKSTLRPGTVFYFVADEIKSKEPHRFIVLNHDPQKDVLLILVSTSSQIVHFKTLRGNCPGSTLVEISEKEYSGLTKPSIVDCNKVFLRTVDEIIAKWKNNELKLKDDISIEIVKKLRQGVLDSNIIEPYEKDILRQTK